MGLNSNRCAKENLLFFYPVDNLLLSCWFLVDNFSVFSGPPAQNKHALFGVLSACVLL
jgi:hypothetical protein